ncbi:glycosyltransferase [Arenibacter echinorum]|uniref:Glycosyltransferase involved in cell wall biosynthesis n=1 Tax=Arenibacter echinorum TaxID=440515 RepID=A0A327QTT8_9FLAO|nr:glycosyltransferase [Arenibacter echinorum]RAJ07132.1 glycosyltransferase involved in cell wall biosynthesis [Arenibacter echinorum]
MKQLKIFITYEKGATINRIFAYANVLSEYFSIQIIMLTTEEHTMHREMLNSSVKLDYVFWNGRVSDNFIIRFIREFALVHKLSKRLSGAEDIIFVSIPFYALIFLPFWKKNKAKKILDIRDLNWEYLESKNFVYKFAKSILSFFAKQFIPKYKAVIVTNSFEADWVKVNAKIQPVVIPNGISEVHYLKLCPDDNSKPEMKSIKVISYIGNVGIAQNLLRFIKIIRNYPEYEFRIIGHGNDYKRIESYLSANKVTNVFLEGQISFQQIPLKYGEADILFAQLDPNFKTAVPSKIFEMLTTNKPIIYSGEGIAIDVLKKFDNVYYFKTNKDLADILRYFNQNNCRLSEINNILVGNEYIREKSIMKNLQIFTS